MKRWFAIAAKKLFAGSAALLLALGTLSGCQPTFLSKEVFEGAHTVLPAKLEQNACPIMEPLTAMTKSPPTVNDPDRSPRYLSLQEAIAIALETGRVSGRAGQGLGRGDTNLASFAGNTSLNSQTEDIRVLARNPAITFAALEASASRFDAIFYNAANWTGTDNLQQGLSTFNNGHGANYGVGFVKPLATGGFANISMLVNYQNLSTPPTGAFSTLNPQYTSRLIFGFEQPLWKDWGVEINQLLPRLTNLTGLSLNPTISAAAQGALNNRQGVLGNFVNQNTEGILISRLRFDQQRAEFERNVNVLVVNAEVAYWNLYDKYGQLYTFEENLRIMHFAWQQNYIRFKSGASKPSAAEYYQVLGQFEEFRAERLRALNEVLQAERELRRILGLSVEDGTRLVPISPPTLAEAKPSWELGLQDAMNLRPEIILARDNLRYHQYLVSIQKNNINPDLRAHMRYEPVGFGSTLTGDATFVDGTGTTRTSNSFQSLKSGQFNDYTIGLTLSMPLGFRAELAAVRAARLELLQSHYFLRDQEEKAASFYAEQYAQVAHWYERIKAHRAERLGYAESVTKRLELIKGGAKDDKIGDPAFLESQRRYSAALVKEYAAIAEYNNSLARLEWSKGTILQYNNIHINEGELPQYAQVRAVDYERERTGLKLRDRPDSLHQPGRLCGMKDAVPPSLGMAPPLEEQIMPGKEIVPLEKSKPGVLPEKANIDKLWKLPNPQDQKWSPMSLKDATKVEFQASPIPQPLPKGSVIPQPLPSVNPTSLPALEKAPVSLPNVSPAPLPLEKAPISLPPLGKAPISLPPVGRAPVPLSSPSVSPMPAIAIPALPEVKEFGKSGTTTIE